MLRALALARKGQGAVLPNPMVGAVVVDGSGNIAGEGFHRHAGGAHAEIEALDKAGGRAAGGTLYVTLEPCNHHGRTPPCVERVAASGVKRVVVAMRDPNPLVKGGGIDELRKRGIEVEEGIARAEAVSLNSPWIAAITTGRPWVILKLAVSRDGKIAFPPNSPRRWITGAAARRQVQRLRASCDAVLTGIGTVMADDPRLTNRSRFGRQPLRVVLDTRLRIEPGMQVLGPEAPTLVISGPHFDKARAGEVSERGAEHLVLSEKDGMLDLDAVFSELARRGVQGVLCEPGPLLSTGLLRGGHVDRLVLYRSPESLGGDAPAFPEELLVKSAGSGKLLHSAPVGTDRLEIYELKPAKFAD